MKQKLEARTVRLKPTKIVYVDRVIVLSHCLNGRIYYFLQGLHRLPVKTTQ